MSESVPNTFFTNHFLIAMPALTEPVFNRAVVYICEHSEEGAIGIIINAPLNMTLMDVLLQMQLKCEFSALNDMPVVYGGPMQPERGFIIHPPFGKWNSTLKISSKIAITTSQDILQALTHNEEDILQKLKNEKGIPQFVMALGYTGWGAEQLEQEIMQNVWLTCPADPIIMFDTPFQERWIKAAALLGVDMNILSDHVGHA